MLYPTPALTAADQRVLDAIEDLRHRLHIEPTGWVLRFRDYLTADAVAASNHIEGFRVSTQDSLDLMDGERDVAVSAENRDETLAYHRVMAYLRALPGSADFAYSKGLLNGLHWMLQGHRHTGRKPAGQWRRGQVFVTDPDSPGRAAYTAPAAADVPGLVSELVEWLNTDDSAHPLVRAAMAHLHLVSIHPWADGNGRMSRSLQTLMIAREGVLALEFSSIEAWFGRIMNTMSYYRELQRRGPVFRPDQDVSGWVRLNLTAYHQQAQYVHKAMNRSAVVWAMIESDCPEERFVSAMHDVAVIGRIRLARYARSAGLTPRQAQRDLRDLVVAGVLEPAGRTRARYYVEGPRFPEPVLEVARTPMTLTEPYSDAVG